MTAQAQAYAKVVAQLQGAARGRWVGPAIAPGVLNQALSTTAGLDTKALVGQVSAAVGKSGPQGLSGGIMDQILRLLGQIAVGTISSGIASIIEDWARGRKDAKDFEKSGRDAACAIDRIDKGCSTSSSAIIEVMGQAVGLLCVQLRLLEPMCGPAHAAAFASVLRIATTLIDCAGRLVMDTCHDRDDAIKGCFELLLKRGDALCEAPSRPVPGESSEDTCPQPPAQECPAPETPKTPKPQMCLPRLRLRLPRRHQRLLPRLPRRRLPNSRKHQKSPSSRHHRRHKHRLLLSRRSRRIRPLLHRRRPRRWKPARSLDRVAGRPPSLAG